ALEGRAPAPNVGVRIHGRFLLVAFLLALCVRSPGAEATPAADAVRRLQGVVDSAVSGTWEEFAAKQLQSNQLAVTLVDLRGPEKPSQASYRGGERIYPASVVKLFYLVAAHEWLEKGRLADTPELRRAMRDMIVESYNEATHYVIDLLTGTTSGPELPDREIDEWFEKRNAVNRYFLSLGYTNINANKKPWCEGPYGRESQSIKRHKPNRNMLTTDATARLLTEIVTGRAVTAKRSAEMLELMKRDPTVPSKDPDSQAHVFSALGLPPGAKLWSKAGLTSQTRHDAACVELPNGARFVLVTFTTDHANERGIIASITRRVVAGLSAPP
ncbi:MAG: serine hydrolase, partial [Anaerolineales bacterium]